MKKEELWIVYVTRNPQFEGEAPFRITPAGLRKLFDQTWDVAEKTERDSKSLFEEMFGK